MFRICRKIEEAKRLSAIFWNVKDKSIENGKNGVRLKWVEGARFWNEILLMDFSVHIKAVRIIDV